MASHRTATFATLEPQLRYISEARIKKRWQKRAPEGAQEKIIHILREVERAGLVQKKHRKPGRHGVKDDKEEGEVMDRQQGIDEVVAMISKRIAKMPFPPGSQESDFDLEKLLDTNHALESQLTANNHSISLLHLEIEKEKRALDDDQQQLEVLEEALRRTDAMRRKQAKNFHPLAKTMLTEPPSMDAIKEQNMPIHNLDTDLHILQKDPDIAALLRQLRSHLDSMEANTAAINGIEEAIAKSQATLDTYLPTILNKEQIQQLYNND